MTDSRHIEIERKYDVDETATLPDLSDIAPTEPGGVVPLRAEYFDTADGVLAAHRIVLRRREGGADEGWHIKVPAALGRLERHWPLALEGAEGEEPRVPEPVLDAVRARVRDRPVAVIARLNTRRTLVRMLDEQGRRIVEIADDVVTASDVATGIARVWREWEVELDDDAPADPDDARVLLDEIETRVLRAGARPAASASKLATALGRTSLDDAPASSARSQTDQGALTKSSPGSAVVVAALAALVDDIVVLDARVRERQPDSMHQLRTRVRRIRSLLTTYSPLFATTVTQPLRAELRHLGAVLGEARDAEVMEDRARAIVRDHETVSAAVADELGGRWHTAGEAAMGRVLAEMSSARYFRLLDSLDALVADPAALADDTSSAKDILPSRLSRDARRVRARARTAADDTLDAATRDEALHETRKAAKRLRYAAEAVSSGPGAVYGGRVRALASAAEAVHDLLGEYRDGRVMQEHLRVAASTSAFPFDYGVLHEVERLSAALCLDDYPAALRSLAKAAARLP
ncbi:CHAD domain-containing protein [Marisediminicola sp. LYQ134]|uniref:CYTH and CHAD domain-containing protein n=1 Tax=Marisediminicola sp. LYQ134 TaxID=3391061 RepID=UPI003982DF33